METKVDKRTNAYKDSIRNPGIVVDTPPAVEAMVENVAANGGEYSLKGKVEDVHHAKPDYSKAQNNPGFKLCMRFGECGNELEFRETNRVAPELCHPCTWRNA